MRGMRHHLSNLTCWPPRSRVKCGPAKSGVELIFTERGTAAEAIYDTAPFARFYNDVIRSVVRRLVADWPAGRPLRVLEVGGGTGGVTAAIIPLLPPHCTEYTFTDLSDA